jgi:hypothetical protein
MTKYLRLCLRGMFVVSLLVCTSRSWAKASASQVTQALDSPSGIVFSDASGDWSRKTGTVSGVDLKGITTVNNDYLVASSPKKASPRNESSFTMTFQGSGYLSFRYRVSLDDWNDAELCFYDGDAEEGYLWGDSGWWSKDDVDWDEDGKWDPEEDGEWWLDEEIYFGADKYSRIITVALFGPENEDYEKPEVYKEWDEVLYNKAWLDDFVWTPDTDSYFFLLSPSPDGTVTFADTLEVLCYSDYDSFVFYYTTDGSRPTGNSALYDAQTGIVINESCTVSVVIYENGQPVNNIVYTGYYSKKVGTPQLRLSQDAFSGSAQLDFSSETPGAEFYYTLNGGTPQVNGDGTPGAGTYRGASCSLNASTQVTVMAVAPGAANSELVTQSYEKLAPPILTCLLDGQDYSDPPIFDQQAQVALRGPAGAMLWYKIDGGGEQLYSSALNLSSSATIIAQARQDGKISSEPVSMQLTKSSDAVSLPAVEGTGWRIFSLPGEVSQATSERIIAAWQPIAYDAQRRVYARASRIRGGQGYWIFGEKPALSDLAIVPTETSVRARSWQLLGGAQLGTLPLASYLADRWDNVQGRFAVAKPAEITELSGLWLYYFGTTK